MQVTRRLNIISMLTLLAVGGVFGRAESAPPSVDPAAACRNLAGATVAVARIGLPTSGASVTSATLQPAVGSGAAAKPEYCKVLAQIAPVDPQAQPINVQLNLPTAWNGKAVQMGGGGLDGVLVTAEGAAPGAGAQPTPLSRGYATFGSDGGHHVAKQFDPEEHVTAFMNDEVLANYAAGEQLKKTHDVAMALIQLRYGRTPRRTYFVGASYGAREALGAAQKWGADYDGAISFYPAAGGLPFVVQLGRLSRALAKPGAFPNRAKQGLVHRAAVAACDAADGAADGIISDPRQCQLDITSIRCASGADEGDTCLSDAQIDALQVMSSDVRLTYPIASGETGMPGYPVFQDVNLVAPIAGLGSVAPESPASYPEQAIHNLFYDVFVRGMLMRDQHANSLEFDPENPGPYTSRMSALSSVLNASNPDLSRFERHGGKLILVHGTEDALLPVGWSENYYNSVVRKMGAATVDRFMRFYVVPGYGHFVGEFVVDWDSLTALDHWVEAGIAPTDPIGTDVNPAGRGRTRPLCRYPTWPRFKGAGDINSAENFTCVQP
jgi:hypothetical protein